MCGEMDCVGAVEEVAEDWAAETKDVGAMDAELVGATCERI